MVIEMVRVEVVVAVMVTRESWWRGEVDQNRFLYSFHGLKLLTAYKIAFKGHFRC